MGFFGRPARYRSDGHLYNQSLVSALPYADIGVIAEFDEGDSLSIQYPRSVKYGRPFGCATETLGHWDKVFLIDRSIRMLPSTHRLGGKKGPGALSTVCQGLVARNACGPKR